MEKKYAYAEYGNDIYIGIIDEDGEDYGDATISLKGQWAIEPGCVAIPDYKLSKEDKDDIIKTFAEKVMRVLPVGNFDAKCTVIKLKENWKDMCEFEY